MKSIRDDIYAMKGTLNAAITKQRAGAVTVRTYLNKVGPWGRRYFASSGSTGYVPLRGFGG